MVEFPDPASRYVLTPGCSRCPELVASRECIAWGNGSTNADVMVVGEAPSSGTPGAEQWQGGNWTGLAYTGSHSGRIIRGMFEELGFGPNDLYVTNAVKCFPSDGSGSNREPMVEERRACFTHLRTELELVEPVVVVATGKHPTQSLLEHEERTVDSFLDLVLEPIECPTLGATLLPILHPSYQTVWIPRLGYDRSQYIAAIGKQVTSLLSSHND